MLKLGTEKFVLMKLCAEMIHKVNYCTEYNNQQNSLILREHNNHLEFANFRYVTKYIRYSNRESNNIYNTG